MNRRITENLTDQEKEALSGLLAPNGMIQYVADKVGAHRNTIYNINKDGKGDKRFIQKIRKTFLMGGKVNHIQQKSNTAA